tara:strand:- start:497 stop:718 length:222 start_codon:yes stop_codon:yes gene_type:complete
MEDRAHVYRDDLFDIACHCHAALAQDSPNEPKHYINLILNLVFGYLDAGERKDIDAYLADKSYLPPADIKIVK